MIPLLTVKLGTPMPFGPERMNPAGVMVTTPVPDNKPSAEAVTFTEPVLSSGCT